MSRVGKKPIPLPGGVKVTIGGELLVEGPKGSLTVPIPAGVRIEKSDAVLEIRRDGDQYAAAHGLTRALAANAVTGVSTGFTRELDIVGIGYRAEAKVPTVLSFTLGYSHPIEYVLPQGIVAKVEKNTHIVLSGIDKQALGQVAANIRELRPPEPYKQKGIRYTGETVRKKVGKTGAGGK
jgi:large subunit ribosomal protein L6